MRERGQISFHIERSEIFHNVRKHIISRFAWQNISLIFTARQYAFISVTHYTLPTRSVKKGQRISHSLSLSVGANCVRPRAFKERPYEDDFLSVGKTCFMVGVAFSLFLSFCFRQINRRGMLLLPSRLPRALRPYPKA